MVRTERCRNANNQPFPCLQLFREVNFAARAAFHELDISVGLAVSSSHRFNDPYLEYYRRPLPVAT